MRKYLPLLCSVIIASCSSPGIHSFPAPVTGADSETPHVTAHSYKLLYSFKGLPDGAYPEGALTYFKGELYGVTSWGGAVSKGTGEQTGTVYKITPDGQESVVYIFKGYPDADSPRNAPIAVNGTLYGATPFGGYQNYGTIYKLTASGKETVMYKFMAGDDGYEPYGGLIYVNGLLYGAAYVGGFGNGLIYSISLSGQYKVLHRFRGGPDGSYPYSKLTYADGKLWGTTAGSSSETFGTVFTMTLSGKETPIYQFKGPPDGAYPDVGLVAVKGLFYSTTGGGGAKQGGTLYSISTNGQENVLHTFPYFGGPQGILYVNGALYGATANGGKNVPPGRGTIYKTDLSGNKTALYQFTGKTDGDGPSGPLTEFQGRLYGVTTKGGQYNWGTVYSIAP